MTPHTKWRGAAGHVPSPPEVQMLQFIAGYFGLYSVRLTQGSILDLL